MEEKKSPQCPNCGSNNITPIASNWLIEDTELPLWYCNICRNEWRPEEKNKTN